MAQTAVSRPVTAEWWARALNRALEEALDVLVEPVSGEAFVESGSEPGKLYAVSATSCSCPAGVRGYPCKHRACYLAQMGELPGVVVVTVPASEDCPDCYGNGALWYRGLGASLPCETCKGTGIRPRPADVAGEPQFEIVAGAETAAAAA